MSLSWYSRLRVWTYFFFQNMLIRMWKRQGLPRRGLLPTSANIEPTYSLTVQSTVDRRRKIKVNILYPPGKTPGDLGVKLPVHLNVHGSGFCLDVFPTEAEFAAYIASKGGCIVVDTDYAKAPHRPFPEGYNDVSDVVAYILSRPDDWDLSRFTLGGVSSGGCLALAAAVHQPKGVIKAVATLYPAVDIPLMLSEESKRVKTIPKGNPGYPLNLWVRTRMIEAYTRNVVDFKDTRLSPLNAPADAFPPITIIGGDCDPLLPGFQKLAKKLCDAGVDYEEIIVEGAGHGWERMVTPGNKKWEKLRDDALEFFVARIRSSWSS